MLAPLLVVAWKGLRGFFPRPRSSDCECGSILMGFGISLEELFRGWVPFTGS